MVRFAAHVPAGGTVLDIACGRGRHTRFFLDRGHPVVAVDRDTAKIQSMATRRLEIIAADLEDGSPWPLGARRFAAVIVTNYLYRPLLPVLIEAVAAGGVLLYETFAKGHERLGRPMNPDFLLDEGELAAAVAGKLDIIAVEQKLLHRPKPALIQRICAVAPGAA